MRDISLSIKTFPTTHPFSNVIGAVFRRNSRDRNSRSKTTRIRTQPAGSGRVHVLSGVSSGRGPRCRCCRRGAEPRIHYVHVRITASTTSSRIIIIIITNTKVKRGYGRRKRRWRAIHHSRRRYPTRGDTRMSPTMIYQSRCERCWCWRWVRWCRSRRRRSRPSQPIPFARINKLLYRIPEWPRCERRQGK